MNNTAYIQSVQKSDLPTLAKVAKSTFVDTYEHLNDPKNFSAYLAKNFSLANLTEEFNHPTSAFFFLKIGEEIGGYYKLNWGAAQTDSPLENAIQIERIYIKQAFQGRKLGKKIIEESVKFAEEKGKNWIWLGVWEQNPNAFAFYERMNFKAFGKHVFELDTEQQTDFLMKREVT